jgi:predicted ester cyclase
MICRKGQIAPRFFMTADALNKGFTTAQSVKAMTSPSLVDLYRAYIDCLNRQDWDSLGRHVDDDVRHNSRLLGLAGYRAMLVKDFADIPDLRFHIELLTCTPPIVGARLAFHCSPKAEFLGLDVGGRMISFAEHVFYEFKADKIVSVWSILDKIAIESQL